jgi:hypothetical protein
MRGRERQLRMARRERPQSWRLTRRELHKTLSRAGRKWIKEVWDAATGIAARFERLSPLTTVLGNRLVESYAAREQLTGEDLQRALAWRSSTDTSAGWWWPTRPASRH